MKRRPDLEALISKHRQLDIAIATDRRGFLSDWNCDNPLLEELLGPELAALTRSTDATDSYIYFDDDDALLEQIAAFHAEADEEKLTRANILAGPGSSSFLAAFAMWLRRAGYTDVYCVPPLYHTLYFLLESLDITVTPLATKHAYEESFSLNLPNRHTVLLLCDPVWYAGKPVPRTVISMIADWQKATKSVVFVDGSFQYMKWATDRTEHTSALDPDLTFRLICPAKTLAAPLYRFAYLLHPSSTHDEFMFLYESMIGGSSAADQAFARRALQVLRDDRLRRRTPEYFQRIFQQLVERNLIHTTVMPECGYFAFAVPIVRPTELILMDQSYFELDRYPNYCRINLMAARRIYALT